ncbi:MAG TPA: hypothetical protein VNL98_13525, partial [Gemmatimonadales bacterium]|nr:hypothetical protein [Gemmatimonadales bacterium]
LCPDSPLTPDTSDRYVAPAAAPDGRIAFVYTRRRAEAAGFSSYQLVLGSLRFGGATRLLAELPFTLDGEPTYNGISHLRWLSPDTIIYRGDFEGRVCLSGPPCAAYEARSGRGLVLHRLSTGERQLIPGTRYASSVTVSEPGVILYTLGGDTRVFRRNLATGVVTVVYDAGSDIVREVEAAGNRLVLLAGGSVSFYEIESVGLIQVDRGGQIRVLDLATGEVTVVDLSAPWRQLALSPDGRRLVAESSGDLFLLELP